MLWPQERRRAEFLETKRRIVRCMEELEQSPESSFERDVVCEDEEAFCLSVENIAALKALLQQLEIRRAQKEALCEELRSRVLALWDRLQVPAEERDTFAPYLVGSGSKIMNALQLEVDRLEQLKLHNLRNVVEAIRVELAGYWDKCFYSEEQRHSFSPYYQDDFTEELLQQHDNEVIRMKHYYEAHQEMFEGIHKWEENWHLFQELERKATDPSRFTNRGGNLLKEEKLRVKLQKTLPKARDAPALAGPSIPSTQPCQMCQGGRCGRQSLQEELQGRVERWEQEHGTAFLVNGQPFLEYVAEQWRLHHLEKEKERQERQLKKSRQMEEEMMYGSSPRTPNKRRVLGLTTPGKMRKLNTTTTCTPNSTIRSALGGSVFSAPGSHPPLSGRKPARTPSHTASKPSRHGRLEHNKENISQLNGTALSGGCFPTAPLQRTSRINSVASTYSEFARELSKASKSEPGSCILNSTASNFQG
ncbi:hypothetical protein JD844_014775 [Phrynosoma platyrhinos]|uniref:Protein regulator of cytokinesis 1 n=1 Tax=Phrynosoma platyrhinos TaxID=52577 RepID=A0ABQ7SRZ1_PHRPL|nr:hypothetical protein JD844_014775 [Phrynosoma platyrhinos]